MPHVDLKSTLNWFFDQMKSGYGYNIADDYRQHPVTQIPPRPECAFAADRGNGNEFAEVEDGLLQDVGSK